jgi:hypothetical protein
VVLRVEASLTRLNEEGRTSEVRDEPGKDCWTIGAEMAMSGEGARAR